MMTIPESMKAELGAWNSGKGIDLVDWTGCTGSFSLAVGYSEIFWPRFVAFEKYVLMEGFSVEGLRSFERNPEATRQSVEWVMNHLHITDLQHDACPDVSSDKLIFLGERLREIYMVKLAFQFPDRQFLVEFSRPEEALEFRDYQLSFFQV